MFPVFRFGEGGLVFEAVPGGERPEDLSDHLLQVPGKDDVGLGLIDPLALNLERPTRQRPEPPIQHHIDQLFVEPGFRIHLRPVLLTHY